MKTRFNFSAALQSAAHLVKLQPNQRLNYTRALKLLYIAERELFTEIGALLTSDRPCAMENGPVLSQTYNLIKGKGPKREQSDWTKHLRTDGYDLVLESDPGHGELSKRIRGKLEEVSERFKDFTGRQLIDATHEFPEWKAHYQPGSNSSFPYEWEELLHGDDAAESIQLARKHEATRQILDDMFGS